MDQYIVHRLISHRNQFNNVHTIYRPTYRCSAIYCWCHYYYYCTTEEGDMVAENVGNNRFLANTSLNVFRDMYIYIYMYHST